jgi:hypothetical protein
MSNAEARSSDAKSGGPSAATQLPEEIYYGGFSRFEIELEVCAELQLTPPPSKLNPQPVCAITWKPVLPRLACRAEVLRQRGLRTLFGIPAVLEAAPIRQVLTVSSTWQDYRDAAYSAADTQDRLFILLSFCNKSNSAKTFLTQR